MMKLEFSAYVQAFEDNNVTNRNKTRSIGSITLPVTPNKSCEYKFMSLNTGQLPYRRQFTILYITDNVIARMNELKKRDKQPLINNGTPSVEWRPG